MSETKRSCLVIDVKPGEIINLNGPATVELVHKSGHYARLRVSADPDVRIKKQEHENKAVI